MEREQRKVAIVGAGISGLLACKYTLAKGFLPTVFELQSVIGGVWSKTIETTKLQTPKGFYQFSDFPWPPSVAEEFPNHDKVLDYVQSYANHFDLLRHIRFNSRVTGIAYEGPSDQEMGSWNLWGGNGEAFSGFGKWKVSVEDCHTHATELYEADFVILCIGRFSGVPNIPEFPPNEGPEVFDGEAVHSMHYTAKDYASTAKFVAGKQVTVVGLQKFAMDIAVECSTANELNVEKPCTVLYKTEHWNVPNYVPWGVHIGYLYLNRFAELSIHKPGEGVLLSLLATLLSPLRWATSKFVESYIKWKLPLAKFGMIPKHSFNKQISTCLVATVPEEFYDRVERGSISLRKFQKFRFCKEGIVIDDQDAPLKTDLVIFATGFRGDKKLRDIFSSETFQGLIIDSSPGATIPLYRECVHPRVPQLAIIGFSESLANLYTSEMRCRWVAELLDGTFKLPSIREMEQDIAKWDDYMKQYAGEYHQRSCIAPLHIWYNDQVCKDMKWNSRRKKGFLAEWFEPYGPMDYCHP